MKVLAVAMLCTMLAGCAAPLSSSTVSAGPAKASSTTPPTPATASAEVVCDTSQFQPPPSLTCGPAITAAQAVLRPSHAPITRAEFRWGGLCPPGAPCAPPLGDAGIVIFDFAAGPPVFVYVSAGPDGVVAASPPAPYPSGY